MQTDEYLSPDEIRSLTGKTWRASQIHELKYMGILHRVRSDGSIAVMRKHIEDSLRRSPDENHQKSSRRKTQPNFEALKNA